MEKLSLRLRIFLFFSLIALGGTALSLAAIWVGYQRALSTDLQNGFLLAGILSAFGLVALSASIWLLFDENVAKPIEHLAADLRTRAHAGVDEALQTGSARYLGDLAPAAQAVSDALSQNALGSADRIANETARLAQEKAQLTALLTEIPMATLLIGTNDQIVLYDGQAADILAQVSAPRLGAMVTDYFEPGALMSAKRKMEKTGRDVEVTAETRTGQDLNATLKPLENGFMMIMEAPTVELAPDAARPLVFDFSLMSRKVPEATQDSALRDLVFCVFDTETTGLLPHKDEIVQIGALRVVNGRIIEAEQINQLVDPGRPIPPASTKVHHVTDAMVAGQPDIVTAGRAFHAFAKGAVIVAHNAPFDMAFLHRHKAEMQVAWDNPILDTVLLSAVLFGASQKHTLDALCDRLGITIPAHLRHSALGDAQATAEALVKMLPMLEARGLRTFGEVIAETRRHGRLLQDLN
ncbi:3'-5' exonuclease [Thalassococcus lentus]|uniref:DNA-directed DNA polymerase n=1 Tax=Thalassococcus lentus TaxID=1210524 RepID=A0ABT4XW14_9RHOB|nr:exonuclease domain-containing protein [Thalassococcus lentus]MDA7426035.1 exonuclease domain-containing protein [Thalassococcus lentus]